MERTDMTGLLAHYAGLWGVQPQGKLTADRPTSHIYKVTYDGRPAVLKLLTPLGAEDERHGALALQCWNGQGAARLYRADARAHLLEYLDGPDCVALVQAGRDREASEVLGQALARIHAAHNGPPPKALTPLEDRFAELFAAARQPRADAIFGRAAEVAQALLAAPLNSAVLHGDVHHENVLHSGRGWLVIDAKGLRGETTYDGAMAVLNPQGHGALTEAPDRIRAIAGILADHMGVRRQRLLRFTFAHACLSASWAMETAAFSSSHALRMARLIEPMIGAE